MEEKHKKLLKKTVSMYELIKNDDLTKPSFGLLYASNSIVELFKSGIWQTKKIKHLNRIPNQDPEKADWYGLPLMFYDKGHMKKLSDSFTVAYFYDKKYGLYMGVLVRNKFT